MSQYTLSPHRARVPLTRAIQLLTDETLIAPTETKEGSVRCSPKLTPARILVLVHELDDAAVTEVTYHGPVLEANTCRRSP